MMHVSSRPLGTSSMTATHLPEAWGHLLGLAGLSLVPGPKSPWLAWMEFCPHGPLQRWADGAQGSVRTPSYTRPLPGDLGWKAEFKIMLLLLLLL